MQKVVTELKKFKCDLDIQDPWADREEIKKTYGLYPKLKMRKKKYDAVLIAVAHNKYKKLGLTKIKKMCKKKHTIFDFKNLFNYSQIDLKL